MSEERKPKTEYEAQTGQEAEEPQTGQGDGKRQRRRGGGPSSILAPGEKPKDFRKAVADEHGWDTASVKKLADLEPMLKDAKDDGLKYPYLTQKTAMFYRWYINDFDFFTGDSTTNFVAVDRCGTGRGTGI